MAGPSASAGATLRIATRGSRQATAQAQAVGRALAAATDLTIEYVLIETTGDRRVDVPLHEIGGQGVFVKEVQRAVIDGRADLAVHSAKDLPSAPTPGLAIGAFCARRDAGDALVGATLDELADGATVASGSVRRRAQLHRVRPDLRFVELRGNIDTRLSKIPAGGAIVMAVAALEILDLTDRITQRLAVDAFVPAVGQGCVAVECRADDVRTAAALTAIDDAPTRHAVEVERAFLAELGSGCTLPVGAHAVGTVLHTFLADPDAGPGAVADDVVALAGPSGDAGSLEGDLARAREAAARAQASLR